MRCGTHSGGYTVIETMIFLAVSGLMFFMSAVFINGKQSKADFKQGVFDFASQIQSIPNDVSNGFFPSSNNFTCSAGNAAGVPPVISTMTGTEQGANKTCVFLGKILQVKVDDYINGSTLGRYNVYSVAARQYVSSQVVGTLPTTYQEAQPKIIDATGSNDVTQKKQIPAGIIVQSVLSNGVNSMIDGIGFFSSFAHYKSSNLLNSGAQSLEVVVFDAADHVFDPTDFATFANNELQTGPGARVLQKPNIVLCLSDDGDQRAAISIGGGNGQRLTVVPKIYGKSTNTTSCPA